MKSLDKNYSFLIDGFTKSSWEQILGRFEDANIYQTWSWGEINWGMDKLSHFVLKKNSQLAAAAQVCIVKPPIIKAGIAYVKWGPMWRIYGHEKDYAVYRKMLRALKIEYVERRSLLLRIMPNQIEEGADKTIYITEEEGYKRRDKKNFPKTIILDLRPDIEKIRSSLKKRWRYNLVQAEKASLSIMKGTNDKIFDNFINLYEQMIARKKFADFMNVKKLKYIQKDLPDKFKMKIMICEKNGKLASGLIVSFLGNIGVYIHGATGDQGLNLNGSNFLQWNMIKWLKKSGCILYDLNGINPKKNPGVYRFKSGFAGKLGKELCCEEFEVYRNYISYFVVRSGDYIRKFYRELREFGEKLKRKKT